MFLRRSRDDLAVTEGAIYRRSGRGPVTETARVLAVSQDGAGIPHVRFAVQFDRPGTAEELRTLALASFSKLFPERIGA